MSAGGEAGQARRGGLGRRATLLAAAGLIGAGAAVVAVILNTEPTATRESARKETAMLVEVTEAREGTFRPRFTATGTVRPAREVILRPRVEGEVVERAPALDPGGVVEQGQTLLRLDPADYESRLRERRSELAQARSELRLERGQQRVAEAEYELLEQELTPGNRALVLREPQLEAARARVEAARAAVEQAELALARTTLRAPFDAQVLSREVSVGSQAAPGDALARLVGTETYWVEATLPVDRLRWLAFVAEGAGEGARVRLRDRSAWPADAARTGRLERLIGELGERTRLARALIAVDDPLARGEGAAERPRLLLGAYLECRIRGRPLDGVVRLEREHLREDETVWVYDDGELAIREVAIAVRDAEYAYIRYGLSGGERVVTSDLAAVREGAALRLKGAAADEAPAEEGGGRG
ncbi:efflux RND transporter periplasmic adaptor subunit [Halorhodospira neutriphila]|uniref:Efflux transporter periplasmic adaptor subunit n=1 Tax=Halorhodospira neutriphila TaxID=168379 RepID=A0ABS1E1Y4_9GAMM|nr:efflux RND transporter periplasmic adaptor subunit [Halorhodospira neutriphila]MBK1725480.1 efflux transporter periplasmic adaptor subunit [Halorhodospira neutriphila]